MKKIEDEILKKDKMLLVLSENSETELISAVFAFAISLEKLNKKVSVVLNKNKNFPKILHRPKKINIDIDETGELFISIDTKKSSVSELRYEKLENELRIHLKSDINNIKKSSISTKFAKSPFDAVLIFGASSKEDIYDFYINHSEIFEQSSIFFINQKPYSQFIFELIHKLKIQLDKKISENILISTLFEIKNTKKIKNTKPFKIIHHLINQSEYNKIIKEIYNFKINNIKAVKMFLKNISSVKEDIFISKIPFFEIRESGLSSKDVFFAIMNAGFLIPEKSAAILLIEPPSKNMDIPALFFSKDKEKIDKVSEFTKIPSMDKNYILFSIPLKNFNKASENIKNLVKDII